MSKVRIASFRIVSTAIIIILGSFYFSAFAQTTTLKSRVAVVTNDTITNIWVSDFPKKTTVIISDSNNNLLSVITTNDYGAAFICLPISIEAGVIAKTLEGDIVASNKAFKEIKHEAGVAATAPQQTSANKG